MSFPFEQFEFSFVPTLISHMNKVISIRNKKKNNKNLYWNRREQYNQSNKGSYHKLQ